MNTKTLKIGKYRNEQILSATVDQLTVQLDVLNRIIVEQQKKIESLEWRQEKLQYSLNYRSVKEASPNP